MTPLDHALSYATLGHRVIPIPVGLKHPGIDKWQDLATTEHAEIRRMWARTPDHGVAIATGRGVVVIDIDVKFGGDETWRELCDANGGETETVECLTGGGGRHLYYTLPAGEKMSNGAAKFLPVGVDVRGDGGQVVAPPTIHPTTGARYAWEVEHDPLDDYRMAPCPQWLLALLRKGAVQERPDRTIRPSEDTGSRTGDRFSAENSWSDLLQDEGWSFHSGRTSPEGDYEMWTRPGKTPKEGASASLYYGGGDNLKVFTSSVPPLNAEEVYTKFGWYAAMYCDGDHGAAAKKLADGYRLVDTPADPNPPKVSVDVDPVDEQPPMANITINAQFDGVVREAVKALAARNHPPRLFQRAGVLARIRQDETSRPVLETLNEAGIRGELGEAARWWRQTKDGNMPVYPPSPVCTSVLAEKEWDDVPALSGIVDLPVLRPDGTFHVTHGHDEATTLFHWHTGKPYLPIPAAPSPQELYLARQMIDDLLCDFPWDDAADKANAWGLLLTPIVRPIVGQVPMALIDAPEPGTGKGLLVNVCVTVATGKAATVTTLPAHEEEVRKQILSALMQGDTTIVFDNVEHQIRSPALAAVLTTDTYKGRILGVSRDANVSNKATWMATGNNLEVGGDIASRCYRIRLDARQSQPWKRTGWKHPDLLGYVEAHRPEILHALCTIVSSWVSAGRPAAESPVTMRNFTVWAQVIGGILTHAGVKYFLANLDAFHAEADQESMGWEIFLNAWREYSSTPMGASELITAMESNPDLKDALPDELSGWWGSSRMNLRLGKALRLRAGRHYGEQGWVLSPAGPNRNGARTYSVMSKSALEADAVMAEGFG